MSDITTTGNMGRGIGRLAGVLEDGAPHFSPENLAPVTQWWDYRDLTAVGDGEPVDTWTSRVGGIETANTLAARPTYILEDPADGLSSLSFDGVDDVLVVNTSNSAVYGVSGLSLEIWIRFFAESGSFGGIYCSSQFNNQIGIDIHATDIRFCAPRGEQSATPTCDPLGAWHTYRAAKHGNRRLVQLDGSTLFDSDILGGTYNNGSDLLFLGDFFGTKFQGRLRHVITCDDALSETEAMALLLFLSAN